MKKFFSRWWLPLLIHACVLAYFFLSEYFSKPRSANDLNLGGAAVIVLSCLLLTVSLIYQFAAKRFLGGFITVGVLVATVSYLFI